MRHSLDIWKNRDSLFNLMDQFEEAFGRTPRSQSAEPASLVPAVDVEESQSAFLISVDLPGVKKEDVSINVTDHQLTISGERQKEVRQTTGDYRQFERVYGKFYRSFQLPQTADLNQIEAHYEDGVLQIVIPKAEAAKPRTIEVKSGKSADKLKSPQSSEKH